MKLQQDREFVELDVPFNGQPKRPGSPSPMASPAHSSTSRHVGGLLHACCGGCCCTQRYQVLILLFKILQFLKSNFKFDLTPGLEVFRSVIRM